MNRKLVAYPIVFFLAVSIIGCSLSPKRRTADVPTVDGVMHTVQKGQTLNQIARSYEVTPELLRRVNNIKNPDHLVSGTRIFIPGAVEMRVVAADQAMQQVAGYTSVSQDGLYHTVQKGETLTSIAAAYVESNVTTRELQRVNVLSDPSHIEVGQTLWIPRAREVQDVDVEPVRIVSAQPINDYKEEPRVKQEIKPQPTPEPTPEAKEEQVHQFPRKVNDFADIRFQWPIKDSFRVIRDFDMDSANNPGIDLGAETGTSVYAAADGKVEVVADSTSSLGASLGNHVIVYHGKKNNKGIYTIYAHNQTVLVEAGQKVERGQELAKVGQSGRPPETESGVLHFQVRELNKAVNPKSVLPPLQ